jgi:hypothetical protein
MVLHDPMVAPLMYELLACLEEEIDKVENPPLYRGLRPGQQVDHLISMTSDECCQGLAWVRCAGFVPSSGTFPAQDEDPFPLKNGGTRAWAITLEMGVVRCSPTPDENSIPSNATWNAVVDAINDDAAAMRRAICCFVAGNPARAASTLPLEWQPIDVEGGCVGGTLQIVVRGPACDCSEAGGS